MNIPFICKKQLDNLAQSLGMKRKKYWGFLKESDKSLRMRVEERIGLMCSRKLAVLGVEVI